jgi:X-Pro dipeptidyl-peptidase
MNGGVVMYPCAGFCYTITWKLCPIDQVIPAGQRLGLVLTLTDPEIASAHSTGATVTVDLTASVLRLPIASAGSAAAQSRQAGPIVVDDEWSDTAGTRFQ